MATRIEETSTLEHFGNTWWKGVRTLLVSDSSVQAELQALALQVWPGMSGTYAPICKHSRAIFHPSGVKHVAMIRAMYETPRIIGRARVTTARVGASVTSKLIKIFREPDGDGRIIEGGYEYGPNDSVPRPGQFWQVIKGSNQIEEYHTVIQVQTAFNKGDFSLSDALSLEGKVNENSLTIVDFGTAGAETIKCLGVRIGSSYGNDLVDVDYLFQWSGPDVTWNEMCYTQLGTWVVQKVNVYNETQTKVVGKLRETVVFRPAIEEESGVLYETTPELRRTYKAGDFSVLAGFTSW